MHKYLHVSNYCRIFASEKETNNKLNPKTRKGTESMNTTVAKRINFQNEYKTKHNDDSIMLFRDMDFYFMYNEDADRVSEATGINKAHADHNEFTYTAFSARKLDQYLPVLIRKGYRVAICDGDMC